MSVHVEEATTDDKEEWDTCVDQSPQTSVFHQYDALVTLARYFSARLHPLIGYVGEEPVGVFPVFGLERWPLWIAATQPPGIEINIGPALLNFKKLKQRKAEKRHQQFIDACLDWIKREMDPDYRKVATTDRYSDVRPLIRRDHDVKPSYTYILDLEPDEDELLAQFSRDARNNIRNTDEEAYDIREGDTKAIREIVALVQRRYAHQNEDHYLDPELVVDLYSTLDEGSVRPYVCRVDGRIVSGIIVLEYGTTAYRWQGGPKPDVDIPVNELLDWRVIRDSKRKGLDRYDLVGAMEPRLCEYKSKFAPEPAPLYVAEWRNLTATLASETYSRLQELRNRYNGST